MKLSVRKLVAGCVQVHVCQRSRSWQPYVFNISVLHRALELGSLSGACLEVVEGSPVARAAEGMCPWGVSAFWPQKLEMATQRVHLIQDLVSDWGCKWGTNKRGKMQSKRVGYFQVLLILQGPSELQEMNLSLMTPVFVGFLPFFFLWNSPFYLYYLSITYPVAVPQLNSRLHLNHWTSFLVFAFSLPQTSSVQCSHSSNSISDAGRDHKQLLFAQVQDFVQPNCISLCVSDFQLGGWLFTPCIETTGHFTLLGSCTEQAAGPPVRVPEAQRFCMEAAEFLDPDQTREPLRSLLFVFPMSARSHGRHQTILQLGGGITLLLGGLVAAPHLSIVCLQTLWGSGFGD